MAWAPVSHTKQMQGGIGIITVNFADRERTASHTFRVDFPGANLAWLKRQLREYIAYLNRVDQIKADAQALIDGEIDTTPADPDPAPPQLTNAQIQFIEARNELRVLAAFVRDGGTLSAAKQTRIGNLRAQLSAALDNTPALWTLA